MTAVESELLTCILAATRAVEAACPTMTETDLRDRRSWAARSIAIDDLKNGLGVRVDGNWIGASSADRQARRRGLLSLQRRGLVQLHAVHSRVVTHVLLMAAGRVEAERLDQQSKGTAP